MCLKAGIYVVKLKDSIECVPIAYTNNDPKPSTSSMQLPRIDKYKKTAKLVVRVQYFKREPRKWQEEK